jgi:large subunit ribosomal protein L9
MKVLLTQAVKNVGKPGEVKEVKNGFARNYLLPRGMATIATAGTLKQAEAQRQAELRREEKNAAQNQALAAKIDGITVTLRAKAGPQGRLYGAITAADIATALAEQLGQEIDRRRVELEEPIRQLGQQKVPVRLAQSLVPEVTVNVEKSEA